MSDLKRMLNREESYADIKALLFDLIDGVKEAKRNSALKQHEILLGLLKPLIEFLSTDYSLNKEKMRLFDDCSTKIVIKAPASPGIQSSYHLSQRALVDIAN